jgi:hypothetical protein
MIINVMIDMRNNVGIITMRRLKMYASMESSSDTVRRGGGGTPPPPTFSVASNQ